MQPDSPHEAPPVTRPEPTRRPLRPVAEALAELMPVADASSAPAAESTSDRGRRPPSARH